MDSDQKTIRINPDRYATFWMRMLAHNIDLVIIIIPLFLLQNLFENETFLFVFAITFYLIYHIGFELTEWRGSPGKKLLKIRIHHLSGREPASSGLILRNILKLLSALPLLLGFAMAKFTTRKQCLHDWLTNTVVIINPDQEKLR